MTLTQPTGPTQTFAALAILLGMAATVGIALGFQHLGGYIPCMLCLGQRLPYYIGIPVALAAGISALMRGPAIVTRGLLLVAGGLMLWSLYLGAFHAGVEWHWWAGPTDCGAVAAPVTTGGKGVLEFLNSVVPPSCDQAAGRFLGLSFAGWNVVASVLWAGVALRGAFADRA